MEFIFEGIFGKYLKYLKSFLFRIFEKGQIFMPVSGLAPSKLKIKKKIRVGYVYIEESFDTINSMGYGGRTTPWIMGRENRPWMKG